MEVEVGAVRGTHSSCRPARFRIWRSLRELHTSHSIHLPVAVPYALCLRRAGIVTLGALEGLDDGKRAQFAQAMVAPAGSCFRGPLLAPTRENVEALKIFNALDITIKT